MAGREVSLLNWGLLSLFLFFMLSCNFDKRASEGRNTRTALRQLVMVRPSEGRLSGLSHAPLTPSTHRITRRSDLIRLRKAIREQGSFSDGRETADLGILLLATNDITEALSKLEEAARESPLDASIHSDLSAVYLEVAEVLKRPRYLLSALIHADIAWRANKHLLEGGFNRALALEKLSLYLSSREAWSEYVALEKEESWKDEAMQHLSAMASKNADLWEQTLVALESAVLEVNLGELERITKESPQLARSYVEETVLGSWADAANKNERDIANQRLQAADSVGTILANRDRMIRDTVDTITKASQAERVHLISGHENFFRGVTLYNKRNASAALPHFRKATEMLHLEHSPFAHWADFYLALSVYYRPDYDLAYRLLARLEQRVNGTKYPVLLGRILWVMGLIQYEQGRPEVSLGYYARALSLFESAGEKENTAAVQNLLASSLDYLGFPDESWEARVRALQLLRHVSSPQRIQNIVGQASQTLLKSGQAPIASYFQLEGVARAESSGDPLVSAVALCQMASVWESLNAIHQAKYCLNKAVEYTRQVPGQGQREVVMPDILEIMGRVDSRLSPNTADRHYSSAIRRYEESNYRFRLPALYRDRARLRLRLGKYSLAESDFRAGIAEAERHLKDLSDEERKMAFKEARQDLFDNLVRLQVERGSKWQALVDSERSRAYLEEGLDTEMEFGAEGDFLKTIPGDVQFVSYLFLDNLVVSFIVSSDGLVIRKIKSSTSLLERRAEGLLDALKRDDEKRQLSFAGDLFDLLIKPISDVLDPLRRVVIISDRISSLIPFALLLDRSSGRFLIEDYAISYGPSISWYLEMLARVEAVNSKSSTLRFARSLIILGPAGGGPYMPILGATNSEAADIADLLRNHVVLRDSSATPSAVLKRLEDFEVVHFSGHAFHNAKRPFHSWLLLHSYARGIPGTLYAHELMDLRLPKTRLVFLAACSTAGASGVTRYGFSGLARSFWVAGVPTIIASFGNTEDQATRKISRKFYERLQGGGSAVEAMRAVQVEAIRSGDPFMNTPSRWGVFGVFGL